MGTPRPPAPDSDSSQPGQSVDRRGNAARPGRRLRFALGAVLVLTGLAGFGVGDGDAAALAGFAHAVDRWQVDPEFRTVAVEYAEKGSSAMRVRPFFVPAKRAIMGIRSTPGLPKEYAVNPTSRAHYENFSRGPLCAYLHLASEQEIHMWVPAVEQIGQKTGRTDADLRAWLDERKMDFPIVKDAGAVRSLGSLLDDADAGRPFTNVPADFPAALRRPIKAIAESLNFPPAPEDMTPGQQQAVLERLDGYVHRNDPELWRTKQINDFCGGIWAQVFGPPYNSLIVPVLAVHSVCRFVFVGLLVVLVVRQAVIRRRRAVEAEPGAEADGELGAAGGMPAAT